MNKIPQIAIFASGSGSNAETIARYFKEKRTAKVSLIVCNNPNAGVILRAKQLRIPVVQISNRTLNNPDLLLHTLQSEEIDFIVLAGFLKKIPVEICMKYHHKMVNIHPSLLPKYGGKNMYGNKVHQAVLEAHEEKSGITIHYVNEHYDDGDIIFQSEIQIKGITSPEVLAEKIHELEHAHFSKVIESLL
jgi:phosphoribosylglycinamide formyltransferase-1